MVLFGMLYVCNINYVYTKRPSTSSRFTLVYIPPNTTVENPPMYFLLNMGGFPVCHVIFQDPPFGRQMSVSVGFFGSQISDPTGGFMLQVYIYIFILYIYINMNIYMSFLPCKDASPPLVFRGDELRFWTQRSGVFGGEQVCKGSVPQNLPPKDSGCWDFLLKSMSSYFCSRCHLLWRWGVSDVFWAFLFRCRCFGLASGSVDVLEKDVTFHVGGDGGRYGHGCRCMSLCFVAAWCILKGGLKCLPYSGNPRLSSGSWWLSFHVATLLEVIFLMHRKTAVEEEHAMFQKVNCSLSCYFTSRVSVLLNVNATVKCALSWTSMHICVYIYIYIRTYVMLCYDSMY